MLIPNFVNPYEDEFLFSWVSRLAELNDMSI